MDIVLHGLSDTPPPKPIVWIGSTIHDMRRCPTEVQNEAGAELRTLQRGGMPSDW